jgi:hypothetical protein
MFVALISHCDQFRRRRSAGKSIRRNRSHSVRNSILNNEGKGSPNEAAAAPAAVNLGASQAFQVAVFRCCSRVLAGPLLADAAGAEEVPAVTEDLEAAARVEAPAVSTAVRCNKVRCS